jgi:hypothetical protein
MDSAARDVARFNELANRSRHIQAQLWADIAVVAQTDRTAITSTYINSLNETIDLHDKRIAALENIERSMQRYGSELNSALRRSIALWSSRTRTNSSA